MKKPSKESALRKRTVMKTDFIEWKKYGLVSQLTYWGQMVNLQSTRVLGRDWRKLIPCVFYLYIGHPILTRKQRLTSSSVSDLCPIDIFKLEFTPTSVLKIFRTISQLPNLVEGRRGSWVHRKNIQRGHDRVGIYRERCLITLTQMKTERCDRPSLNIE